MKYTTSRSSIQTGDVLAWSHRKIDSFYGFISWLIRLFTQSEYNHVGIAWNYQGRIFVIEAVRPYIRVVPLSSKLPVYWVPLDSKLTEEAENYAFSLVGVGKYSTIEAIKSYFGYNKFNNSWQCVEFVKQVLLKNNLPVSGLDTPAAFILELQRLGKDIIYLD